MIWKKFIVCSDVHGDNQNKDAVRKFFRFLDDWKPHIKIFAGDLWDFRSIRKGASAEERYDSLIEDFHAGCNFLERYKPQYFLRGNHDERLWDLLNARGIEADFAQKGVNDIEALCQRLAVKMLPYHKREGVLRLGSLKVIHGFNSGVYAARQTALAYGSCLFGHIHTIDEHAIPGLERRVARAIGCLCELDMNYNRAQVATLRQAHGWAYGLINEKTGEYHVFQAERVGNSWLVAKEIVQI